MFKVDFRFLSEHIDELHGTYQFLVRESNEVANALREVETLLGPKLPIEQLKSVQTGLTLSAEHIRRLEKAADEIVRDYSRTEERVDAEIEDTAWRARNAYLSPAQQNVSWVSGYMNQIIY